MSWLAPEQILDERFYYSGAEARALFQGYSEGEVRRYFFNELLDLALIATYSWGLLILLHHKFPGSPLLAKLSLLTGLMDLTETLSVIGLLTGLMPMGVLDGLGIITALKWSLGGVFGALALVPKRQASRRESEHDRERNHEGV